MYRFMLAVAAASFGIAASAQAQRQQPVVHHSSRWVLNGHTTMAIGANVEDDFNQIKTASGLGAGFEVGYRVTPRLLAYAGLDINKQPVDMADLEGDFKQAGPVATDGALPLTFSSATYGDKFTGVVLGNTVAIKYDFDGDGQLDTSFGFRLVPGD